MAVPERVVISGAGCCTALGHDLDSVARSLREGRDAFRASGALEGRHPRDGGIHPGSRALKAARAAA